MKYFNKLNSWDFKSFLKAFFGYLLFIFILTIVINSGTDDEGNRAPHLITLSGYITNLILGVVTLALIFQVVWFYDTHKIPMKQLALFYFLLYIFCVGYYTDSDSVLDQLPDTLRSAFFLFVVFSVLFSFLFIRLLQHVPLKEDYPYEK